MFALAGLEAPEAVTVGVRPKRDNEDPVLEANAGRLTQLNVQEPVGSPVVAAPITEVPPSEQAGPSTAASTPPVIHIEESEDEEEEQLVHKRSRSGGESGEPSKRLRAEDEGTSHGARYCLYLFIISFVCLFF